MPDTDEKIMDPYSAYLLGNTLRIWRPAMTADELATLLASHKTPHERAAFVYGMSGENLSRGGELMTPQALSEYLGKKIPFYVDAKALPDESLRICIPLSAEAIKQAKRNPDGLLEYVSEWVRQYVQDWQPAPPPAGDGGQPQPLAP
jgi:hypothetical protein